MQAWLAPYAGYLLDVLEANGIRYTITSVYRSHAKQQALYERWLRGQNAYPVAVPGTSKHELGLAMDVVMPDWAYEPLGKLWVKMGGFWSPKDEIHYSV
jgi:D-alanyl-D-alanine dipeptidase